MKNVIAGLNQRQILHRSVWQRKPALRLLYRDFHQQLLENCVDGPVLDIGGGTAHVKEVRSNIISTDILAFPGIDVVADAHQLPFSDGFLANIVMLDVLHHLERPIQFLREASRVLRPGGRLSMLEPAMTPGAYQFYNRFHEEPVDMTADPFTAGSINPDRDPFDANQAIPTLLFSTAKSRRRLEKTIPSLRVQSVDWLSLIAYPLSGGFQKWSLLPAAWVNTILAIEKRTPALIRKCLAFRMKIVLEKL
jgi:SAM-dependent methyltransferase